VNTAAGVVGLLVTLAYALVNGFGAWMVSRRHSGVAAGFFASAVALTVGAVALPFGLPGAVGLVAIGALSASISSLLNAHLVMLRVFWWRHLLRLLVGALVVTLAYLAVRP